jgi:uncharacterized DUF497 family protein
MFQSMASSRPKPNTWSATPKPERQGEDKWLVWGRGNGGRFVQVVFVVDDDDTVYIIHAKPLTDREKRRYRRRNRR